MNVKMNLFFFQALALGSLGGLLCSIMVGHTVLAGFVGFFTALFSMFTGMTLAFVRSREKLENELSRQQESFQQVVRDVVERSRQSYGQVSINMAKSMSDKIANRVISKYVEGLSDDGRRNAILSSVNQIIEDEFKVMREEVLKG